MGNKRCLNISEAKRQFMKQLDHLTTKCVKVASEEDKVTAENMRFIFYVFFFFTVKDVGMFPTCTAYLVADW